MVTRSAETASYRTHAVIAGVLWITATVATILSQIVMDASLAAPDMLSSISSNKSRFILGVSLELVDAFACAGIAIAMFSVLRLQSAGLAIGYVGFRVMEASIAIVASIFFLSLFTLAEQYSAAEATAAADFRHLGDFLVEAHAWAYLTMLITFCLGALGLNYLLYRSRIVPRIISAWGFVGAALGLGAAFLDMFGVIEDGTSVSNLLYAPIGIQEMVLAVWLIIKGFDRQGLANWNR